MHSAILITLGAALITAQNVPPPPPVLLTGTKSGVLPTLPTPFSGVLTNQGAIIQKGPVVPGYVGLEGPAKVQSDLPQATYTATLPDVPFNALTGTVIKGSITGSANANGTGVTFSVDFSDFPDVAQYGPFVYHIHDQPVPEDGNCTSTLAHLDTTNRGEYFPCDKSNLSTCQTGDLAGKHGSISATTFTVEYTDDFLSTDPSSPYFFGSKSIVIHTSNTTRLTCANFVLVEGDDTEEGDGGSTSTVVAGGEATGAPTPSVITGTNGTAPTGVDPSSPPQFTGAAGMIMANGMLVTMLSVVVGLLV